MDAIILKGSADTPEITLDRMNNTYKFEGKSLPEDVEEFYSPIIQWVEEYAEAPNPNTNIIFKMKYFNTASSKMILDVMEGFAVAAENGSKVEIEWHFQKIDEDMQEAGEGYAEIVDVPFKFMPYSK
jgi:SiaC family regulatory phosphoprotein